MADWDDIRRLAVEISELANKYLEKRSNRIGSTDEVQRLNEWREILVKTAEEIQASARTGDIDQATADIYLEGLQSSGKLIDRLQETNSYGVVEFVMSALHQKLIALAGPHGSGGGRPGRGRPGGGPSHR